MLAQVFATATCLSVCLSVRIRDSRKYGNMEITETVIFIKGRDFAKML